MYDRESGFGKDCFLFLVMVLYSKLQGGAVTNDWEWGGVLQSANTDMIDGSIFQSIFWIPIPANEIGSNGAIKTNNPGW